MPVPKSKSSNACDDVDLNIEVQQKLSRCPSFSSTVADFGFERKEAQREYYDKRDWVGNGCSAGTWPTRGDGRKEEEGEEDANKVQANGLPGQFGVLAANWGWKWGIKRRTIT